MMDYKGYRAVVSYDDEAGIFHGEVVGTRDVITFEGTSVEQLRKEFRFSIDDYLAVCTERGRQPDKPFSGKIPLRVAPVPAFLREDSPSGRTGDSSGCHRSCQDCGQKSQRLAG